MKSINSNMILRKAQAILPPVIKPVKTWLEEAAKSTDKSDGLDYYAFTEMAFSERKIDRHQLTNPAHVLGNISADALFRDALEESQCSLARQAVSQLAESLGNQSSELAACGLTIYSHTAVDENFHQSTVCRIASEFGLSKAPHFSVAQLQGASFFQALDVSNAFFSANEQMQSALFVAAEKWPIPYPRVLGLPAVLGDGAVAVFLTRVGNGSGLKLRRSMVQCFDSFGDVYGYTSPIDVSKVFQAIEETINKLINQDGVTIDDIDIYLSSGGCIEWETEAIRRMGIQNKFSITSMAKDTGYLSAVDAPYKISQVLNWVNQGKLDSGTLVLAYGIGLGGSVGAALFEVVQGNNHE